MTYLVGKVVNKGSLGVLSMPEEEDIGKAEESGGAMMLMESRHR